MSTGKTLGLSIGGLTLVSGLFFLLNPSEYQSSSSQNTVKYKKLTPQEIAGPAPYNSQKNVLTSLKGPSSSLSNQKSSQNKEKKDPIYNEKKSLSASPPRAFNVNQGALGSSFGTLKHHLKTKLLWKASTQDPTIYNGPDQSWLKWKVQQDFPTDSMDNARVIGVEIHFGNSLGKGPLMMSLSSLVSGDENPLDLDWEGGPPPEVGGQIGQSPLFYYCQYTMVPTPSLAQCTFSSSPPEALKSGKLPPLPSRW